MPPRSRRSIQPLTPSVDKPVHYVTVSAEPATSVLIGLRRCVELAAAAGQTDLAIAVPGKTNLFGVLEESFGEAMVKALDRDGRIEAPELTIHLVTRRIALTEVMPVLACFTAADQVQELLASHRCTGLVYIPWSSHDQVTFLENHPTAAVVAVPAP